MIRYIVVFEFYKNMYLDGFYFVWTLYLILNGEE